MKKICQVREILTCFGVEDMLPSLVPLPPPTRKSIEVHSYAGTRQHSAGPQDYLRPWGKDQVLVFLL